MSALLTLHPAALEQQYWSAPSTRQLLMVIDMMACSLSFLNAVAGAARVQKLITADETFNNQQFRMVCCAVFIPFLVLSALPIILCCVRRSAYHNCRLQLCLASRVYRLAASLALVHPSTQLGFHTQLMAVYTQLMQGNCTRALLLNTLQPTVFWSLQANVLLPFRLAVWMQLCNFVGIVCWSSFMPGSWYLPANTPVVAVTGAGQFADCGPGSACLNASSSRLQALATFACERLQACFNILRVLAVPSSVAVQPQQLHVCRGVAALQTLHVLAAFTVLMVFVPLSIYYLEYSMKRSWINRSGLIVKGPFDEGLFGSRGWVVNYGFVRLLLCTMLLLFGLQLPWMVAVLAVQAAAGVEATSTRMLAAAGLKLVVTGTGS
jgi:hypothetical protein